MTEYEERFALIPSFLLVFCLFSAESAPSDEYCPHCDNHYVLDALTPKAALKVESDDTRMDAR